MRAVRAGVRGGRCRGRRVLRVRRARLGQPRRGCRRRGRSGPEPRDCGARLGRRRFVGFDRPRPRPIRTRTRSGCGGSGRPPPGPRAGGRCLRSSPARCPGWRGRPRSWLRRRGASRDGADRSGTGRSGRDRRPSRVRQSDRGRRDRASAQNRDRGPARSLSRAAVRGSRRVSCSRCRVWRSAVPRDDGCRSPPRRPRSSRTHGRRSDRAPRRSS